jgi:uncharacterized protein involved in type VI secretion and phage assembly
MIDEARTDGDAPRYFGVFPAIVTNVVDEKHLGRVEVRFPFLGKAGESVRAWATLLTPYADDDQGMMILPAKDSQVVVGFEAGVLERPYVLGAAWNGREKLPAQPAEANNLRLLKTRSGSLLEFDDTSGAAKITLTLKSGLKLVLDDAASEVQLEHSNGCKLTFDTAGEVTLTATAGMTIDAPSGLTVNAPSTTFSGSVTCQAHTATSVTSPLYSQGAGNVW